MNPEELKLIRWLSEQSGIGCEIEDMSCLELPQGQRILLSTDMVLEGTHFDRRTDDLDAVARKSVLSCLSDCAAMAVRPLGALISLALPKGKVFEEGKIILASVTAAAKQFDCPILGGDTTSWSGPLAIDVAMVAIPWPGITPLRRKGALPGDLIGVTGAFGGSILGKHLSFTPRIEEARHLAEKLGDDLHAMIDVSDGLALDLWRLCDASGCGAILEESLLKKVISSGAVTLAAQDGRPALEHALGDGEDYELIFAASEGSRADLRAMNMDCQVIGSFTNRGLLMRGEGGNVEELQPRGFEH